jgi:hypothetical protein
MKKVFGICKSSVLIFVRVKIKTEVTDTLRLLRCIASSVCSFGQQKKTYGKIRKSSLLRRISRQILGIKKAVLSENSTAKSLY